MALVDNPSLVAGVGPLKLATIGIAPSPDPNTGAALVVERNARLTALALPSLTSIGGQLVIRDNPSLAAVLLPKLAAVNGVANSTRYGPASVVIAGNRALADVASLLPLAHCASPSPAPVLVQLHPAPPPGVPRSAGWYVCTFTR